MTQTHTRRLAAIGDKIADRLFETNQTLHAIRNHIIRLRKADPTIGWTVSNGRFRLVRTTYDNRGYSTVVPLTGLLPDADLLAIVESLD
jgi:hypothetical protein